MQSKRRTCKTRWPSPQKTTCPFSYGMSVLQFILGIVTDGRDPTRRVSQGTDGTQIPKSRSCIATISQHSKERSGKILAFLWVSRPRSPDKKWEDKEVIKRQQAPERGKITRVCLKRIQVSLLTYSCVWELLYLRLERFTCHWSRFAQSGKALPSSTSMDCTQKARHCEQKSSKCKQKGLPALNCKV